MLGMLGYGLARSEGTHFQTTHSLLDPVDEIAKKLSVGLSDERLCHVRVIEKKLFRDEAGLIRRELGEGYILTLKTVDWGIIGSFGSNRVAYKVRAYLRYIEPKPRYDEKGRDIGYRTLWRGSCAAQDRSREWVPYTALIENNAALLKERIREKGNQCAEELLSKFTHQNQKSKRHSRNQH